MAKANGSADDLLNLLTDLIKDARKAGADAADAIVVNGTSVSVTWRLGKLEQLERAEGGDIGLRVLRGKRQAIVSSADRSPSALKELVERAVAMARTVPEDPFVGLAEPGELARDLPALDICDPAEVSAETLIAQVTAAEATALAVKGITNSEGASAGWGRSQVAMAASNGFARAYQSSGSSLSVSVLAGEVATGMETDYDYTSAVYAADMRKPEDIGRTAGERAVRKLGARKVKSRKVPVVFDPRVARGLVGHFLGAINGSSVARQTTFLKDSLNTEVFAPHITIVEDPHMHRGLRSKPCDAEGIANRRANLIDKGVLTTWLLDLRTARQLGLKSTGHAGRGTSSPPSPGSTNVYLTAGPLTPTALMADIKDGLYVTDLVGSGVNTVTGDYSRGAVGFWIENGILTYPVSEITVAGNLRDMFKNLTPASDLELRYGVDAPTVRIEDMSVAGE
ncbi:MAG: TldD/PmbA family protein [Rhodospirillaceae bacterium]|nr:MAG: TldD/PmbA family protein [Rhodospirillaceae bacterium]